MVSPLHKKFNGYLAPASVQAGAERVPNVLITVPYVVLVGPIPAHHPTANPGGVTARRGFTR